MSNVAGRRDGMVKALNGGELCTGRSQRKLKRKRKKKKVKQTEVVDGRVDDRLCIL